MVAALFLAGMACAYESPIIPAKPDPLLYLVLNHRSDFFPDTHVAFLVTAGSPLYAEYLQADAFEMRRASDGALYDWRDRAKQGAVPLVTGGGSQVSRANYWLPDSGSGGLLGAVDIMTGESYTLMIAVGGVTITGSVTVPNTFALSGNRTGSSVHVEWPRVAGSSQYSIGVGGNGVRFVTDTFADVTTSLGPTDSVVIRVKAMDANLSRLVGDDRLRRSGIDGGYGVFGATAIAILTIPPNS